MKDVKIDGQQLKQAIDQAQKIKSSLNDAYSSAESLIQYVNGAQWSGKTRDQFLTYMELILQYHQSMKDASKEHVKALEKLEKSISSFQNESIVQEVKSL